MTSPPPALFVREHVSAPENRLNLALFALLNVPAFHAWFLRRLELPADSVVYPPQNVAGVRPDFVVVERGGGVRCWIEVELGPPDTAQLLNYHTLGGQVLCIAGTDDGDLTLGEIAEAVGQIEPGLNEQQKRSAEVLLDLIRLLAGKAQAWNYAEPDGRLKQQPLITALVERVPSWAWLSRYLPNGSAAQDYADWLAEAFEVDVSGLKDRQSAPVSELALLERVEDLADRLSAMSLAG